jgi:catechol 2,3-dioxygenase-like lactoylglutathione lyase family enzyme
MPDVPVKNQRRWMTLKRMANVGIVVESLDSAISFFSELGLRLEGRATVEGEWAGRVTGLRSQRVEIAMLVTPDGHSRLELSRFLAPPVVADHRNAPVNALGYLRVMFTVDDIDETLARLARKARSSSATWSSTKTCIGSATSAAPKDFSSGAPRSSSTASPHRRSCRERTAVWFAAMASNESCS